MRIREAGLAAVHDVEARRPVEEIVAFAAVELIDTVAIGAAEEFIRAAPAEQRREALIDAQDVVAARAKQRRGAGRHVQPKGRRPGVSSPE